MDDETPRFATFFVHMQRTFDCLGPSLSEKFGAVPAEHVERGRYYSLLSEELIRSLERAKPSTLGEAIICNTLEPGMVVTHYGTFYCRGVGQHLTHVRRDLPDMYTKLDDLRPDSGLLQLSILSTSPQRHQQVCSKASSACSP